MKKLERSHSGSELLVLNENGQEIDAFKVVEISKQSAFNEWINHKSRVCYYDGETFVKIRNNDGELLVMTLEWANEWLNNQSSSDA